MARYFLENDEPSLSFFLERGHRFRVTSPRSGSDIVVESTDNPREYNCYTKDEEVSTINEMCSSIIELLYKQFKFGENAYTGLYKLLRVYLKDKVRLEYFPQYEGLEYTEKEVIITGKLTKYSVSLSGAFVSCLLPQGGSESICLHMGEYLDLPEMSTKEQNILTKVIWCLNDEAFYEHTNMFKRKINRLRKKGWLFSQVKEE